MAAPATTRKPRPPRQPKATTQAAPRNAIAWAPMPETGSDALRAFGAMVAGLRDAMALVPAEIPAFLDTPSLDRACREAAAQEAAFRGGHGERSTEYDRHERELRSAWEVPEHELASAAQGIARGELLAEEAVWRVRAGMRFPQPSNVTVIPLAEVQGAPPLGDLDEKTEKHFRAAFPDGTQDTPGPVTSPHPVPPGPGAPDGGEDEHEPALDEAPPLPKREPLPVGDWTGSGGEEKGGQP